MVIDSINIEKILQKVRDALADPKNKISPELKATIETLILIATMLANRLNLKTHNNDKNSISAHKNL